MTEAILERMCPLGPTLVLPNGVDPAEWDRPSEPPAWFSQLARPVLLYAGTLDERLDLELLTATARQFPHGSVVLVGSIASPDHLGAIAGLANVHVHSRVPRQEITAIVSHADVCLIPHVRTDLTTAMSPLKLYEYLAAGRPVVAVDLPPLRGVDPSVSLVGPDEDFAGAVARAVERGPNGEPTRRRFIAENSWARRHALLLEFAFRRPEPPTRLGIGSGPQPDVKLDTAL